MQALFFFIPKRSILLCFLWPTTQSCKHLEYFIYKEINMACSSTCSWNLSSCCGEFMNFTERRGFRNRRSCLWKHGCSSGSEWRPSGSLIDVNGRCEVVNHLKQWRLCLWEEVGWRFIHRKTSSRPRRSGESPPSLDQTLYIFKSLFIQGRLADHVRPAWSV